MKKVKVTNRNKYMRCVRCGRLLKDTGEYVYITNKSRGRRNHYCEDCWKIIQDAVESKVRRCEDAISVRT